MDTIEKFKILTNDNLTDFETLFNLLSAPNPDIDNIKYIVEKGKNEITHFMNNFSKETESNKTNINYDYKIEDIKNYSHIIIVLGSNAEPLSDTNTPNTNAYVKLKNIVKAFNQGWIPDWNKPNELKYYPWFYLNDAVGGFRLADVYYRYSDSFVSAWLCFRSKELCELSVELFKDIYKEYFEYK